MRKTGTILWALLLIGIGVVLLLRNLDVVPKDTRIWPLVVLVIGAWLFLERLTVGRLARGVTWPLLLIAVGGVFLLQDLRVIPGRVSIWPFLLIAGGLAMVLSIPGDRERAKFATSSARVPLDGAKSGRIRIEHGAGRLAVESTHEPGVLLEGSFAGVVRPDVRRDGDALEVRLSGEPGAFLERAFPWNWRGPTALDWEIGITRRLPVSLEVRSGASSQELDLADLVVPELQVKTGASQLELVLPSKGETKARVEAGAARVRIRVPERVAARIVIGGGVSSVRVDEMRFPKGMTAFQSKDYDTAESRVDLVVEAGAADVEVH